MRPFVIEHARDVAFGLRVAVAAASPGSCEQAP